MEYYLAQNVNCDIFKKCFDVKGTQFNVDHCNKCSDGGKAYRLQKLQDATATFVDLIQAIPQQDLINFYDEWLGLSQKVNDNVNVSLFALHQSAYRLYSLRNSMQALATAIKTDRCFTPEDPFPIYSQLTIDLNQDLLTLNRFIRRSKDFVMNFRWLSQGQPLLNPFVADPATGSEVKARAALLKKFKALKGAAEKKLEDLGGEALDSTDLSAFNNYTKHLLLYQAKIDSLQSFSRRDQQFSARFFKDSLLYQGLLYISDNDLAHYMYHHDAQNSFDLMNGAVKREFREDVYQPVILAHNVDKNLEGLTFQYKIESIKNKSRLDEAIESARKETEPIVTKGSGIEDLDAPDKGGIIIDPFPFVDINRTDYNTYRTYYQTLEEAVTFCRLLLQHGYPQFPLPKVQDDSSNYQTKHFHYRLTKEPTIRVPYQFQVEQDTHKFVFRINKLYRFRFKLGATYSTFKSNSYSITDNAVTANNTQVSGLDATFGMQVFPFRKIDIRERRVRLRPYAYLGFPISKDIVNETFIGIGSEFLNGLGITGGFHIKQNDFLKSTGNQVGAVTRWDAQPFVSILLDVNIFKNIFDFSIADPIENVFKKKG